MTINEINASIENDTGMRELAKNDPNIKTRGYNYKIFLIV